MKDFKQYVEGNLGKSLKDCSKEEVYLALLQFTKEKSAALPQNNGKKKVYYISAEFLIGKLLSNNLINLGLYDEVKEVLAEAGHTLAEIEEIELEPSLGNGGLGRLAACFLDSIATLGLTGDGVGLNYHYGLFEQKFKNNQQDAVPNVWLTPESWLVPTETSYKVPFADFTLTSKMFDIDVLGYEQSTKNKLHLFDVDSIDESLVSSDSISFDKTQIAKNLTLFLYPDDSDEQGELLRIYQQYFMVSNGAQLLIDEALAKGSNLHDLAEYATVQINDTHPSMVIPELIRLLGERGIEFDEAVEIVSAMTAYTNHTILSEALEKWPIEIFQGLLPRVYQIVEEINRRFLLELREKYPNDWKKHNKMSIIGEGKVRMAWLAIAGSFSVNGVAALHTEILKTKELSDWYNLYPQKFNNKTNGVTQRRWLLTANPALSAFITKHIGDGWIKDLTQLRQLEKLADNQDALRELIAIKKYNKERLTAFLKQTQGIVIDPNSIFDVQIKRLHEYKRQLLNILHVMTLYNKIIEDPTYDPIPHTFIFGAKAASGYRRAKLIIKLINTVADRINNDHRVRGKLKVVFVANYCVSTAEKIFPASDISEQISTAGKEASGTGNMKFMLNGAITLGTLDGANIEIVEEVGAENAVIFGITADEIEKIEHEHSYNPQEYLNRNPALAKALTQLIDGTYTPPFDNSFRELYDSLVYGVEGQRPDVYYVLADFDAYTAAQERIVAYYRDPMKWAQMCLLNIARSGKFSSDRTIEDYVRDIWKLEKVVVN